jgi:hypothetical protein
VLQQLDLQLLLQRQICQPAAAPGHRATRM